MNERKSPPFLRVVQAEPEPTPVKRDDFRVAPWQQTLFAAPLPNLLIFINFDAVSESDFLTAILSSRPRYVLDLRPAPRFDLGTLNRRLVFSIFEQVGAQYYDVAGKLAIKSPRDAKLNPALLVPELKFAVFGRLDRVEGPIAILVGMERSDEAYETLLAKNMSSLSELGWEVLRIPHALQQAVHNRKRELMFISHANPEDNDFARWLAARLSTLGYRVWSDITDLVGGEKFWDSIEDAIRHHASKVVVCLSRASQTKEGVLDEIACAIGAERSRGLDNFVIPVRLDDLAFSDVRANVGRKNIIDFGGSWTTGLSELIRTFEHDGVPRPLGNGAEAVALMSRLHPRSTSVLIPEPETVFANWLECIQLPEAVTVLAFDGPTDDPNQVRKEIPRPTFSYLRLIGGFVEPAEAQHSVSPSIRISLRCRIGISEFLKGRSAELPGLQAKESRKYLTSLLREAWNHRARDLGLHAFKTAAGTVAWYLPKGLIPQDTVHFIGPEGIRRRKMLVGRSEKRNVYWHYAIEAVPSLSYPKRFALRPHVIFSEDGLTPINSDARMHSLRRSFCKSWWNDRWRDLTAAYISWFAGFADAFDLAMSDSENARVSGRLAELQSPTRLVQRDHEKITSDVDFGEADWLDDPDIDEYEVMETDEPIYAEAEVEDEP